MSEPTTPHTERHLETEVIRTQPEPSGHREHSSSIYMTSSFTFDNAEHARALFANEVSGSIYSRYSNPNSDEFVEKMKLLEGAEDGIATASGMSAVFTTFGGLLGAGDHILSSKSVFGSTHQMLTQILPRWGIAHSYGEITEPETWEQLLTSTTRLCYVETPSNPAVDLIDLEWLGQFCRQRKIILVVDNVFATPVLQQPIRYGADLVIHSATKYIDGQGRGLGGVILGKRELIEKIRFFARHTGPAISPFNAWMFSKSLDTLALRMERHCANAMALAQFLEGRSEVELVKYPGLPSHPQYRLAQRQMKAGGGIVTFVLRGGIDAGRRFLDALQVCSLTANLGDARTIATHPASTTHSKLTEEERRAVGILPGLVRISVGLEHPDDILADVGGALQQIQEHH
ncbi:MAG: aminotransferase class I/II-fold pyridoxal phosphate-dependent enzyme [Armatimonadetes bacterium]|nr:aminotransferase class I/II-fold pyridoxal phosphate-dependent enzyme [Armatimonadota bacterium]